MYMAGMCTGAQYIPKGYYINPLVMTMQKQTVKKIQPGEYCYMKNR
jgi:hypothetical protein